LKSVVYDMGAPVIELSASAVGERLPIGAALKIVATQFYFENLAENSRVDDFIYVNESRFEATVVAQVEFAWMFVGTRLQFQSLRV
jgi:hypothetical protein